MTIIYDVILKRHNNSSRSNVCIFMTKIEILLLIEWENMSKKMVLLLQRKMVVLPLLILFFEKEKVQEK